MMHDDCDHEVVVHTSFTHIANYDGYEYHYRSHFLFCSSVHQQQSYA